MVSSTPTAQPHDISIASDPVHINRVESKDLPIHEEEIGLKHERDVQYDAQEDPGSHTGLRRVLRRNPSYEFIREVAVMDEQVLDDAKVKRVRMQHDTTGGQMC
jgi:hypothetical protein